MLLLRGVSHVHSRYSFDGKLPLSEVRDVLKAGGCDFALMSEHIEEMTLESVQTAIGACRALSTPECLLIPGIEMDALNILVFGVDRADRYDDLRQLVRDFQSQGALIVLSHPVKISGPLREGIEDILEGVEVWNSRHDGRGFPRTQNLRLYRRMRAKKPDLVPLFGLDFHGPRDYAEIRMEVEAEAKTQDAIMKGLRAGRVRIMKDGRPVSLDPGTSRVRRAAYTFVRDGIVRTNRALRLRPPSWVRRVVRKFL